MTVAAAKKLGLLAILAKFGKVIFIGGAALVAALAGRMRGLFGGRRAAEAEEEPA